MHVAVVGGEVPASGPQWGYRPALDGLRAVAVYLVVVFHADVTWLRGGFVGVDVFFVLSGFLVTSVLLAEWSVEGRIDLRRFYARRVRRLLPAAAATIAVTAVLSTLVLSRLSRRELVGDAQASLLYVANWNFLRDATDYFAADTAQSPFLHFWSLAIEEQFYVVFPALLIVLLHLRRRRRGVAVVVIALVCVGSVVAQIVIAGSSPLRAYYRSDTRVYQMLAGVLLAFARSSHRGWWSRIVVHRPFRAAAPVGLGGLLLVASGIVEWSASVRGLVATVVSVLLIGGVEAAPRGRTARLLSTTPFVHLGRISYGTYLWHWPVIVLMRPLYDAGPYRIALIAAVLATGLAAVSSFLLETRIRRWKPLDRFPREVVAVGLATSVLVALVVVPPVLGNDRRPIEAARDLRTVSISGDAADSAARAVPDDLDLDATQPIDVDRSRCRPETPEGCVIVEGSGPHVHLIGDSNADMIVGAMLELADENDWTLSMNTALGCPWQRGLAWVAQGDRITDQCDAARDDWYDTYIPALRPDLIVAVGVPRDPQARSDGSVYVAESPGADIDADVARATEESLDALKSATPGSILLLEPLPYALDLDPTECLTTADTVGQCAYDAPGGVLPVESTYRSLARDDPRVSSADIDRIACPFLPTCLPVIDDEIVFRNQLHLSDAWLVAQRQELDDVIRDIGALDPPR